MIGVHQLLWLNYPMKKHYPWLWFDADNTLFDYDRAEATALQYTFSALSLPFEDSYLEYLSRDQRQTLANAGTT